MAAALLRPQRARVWADILAPAAEANAAGALWQGNADVVQYIRPLHILRLGLQSLRCLPAAVTASCVGKCSQQLPEQPLTALLCQGDTAADKQQRITPLHQATKQPGQTAASQGGPGQKPVKQQVIQDTLLKEVKDLLVWPLHRILARTAVSLIPTVIEEEFNASQFLEGCKGAFVAVHESMHSTRDLAAMVSLPVLNAYAHDIGANEDKKLRCRIRPGSVNPGQPSIVGWGIVPRKFVARHNMARAQMGRSLVPMPGIAADDENQDCPEKVDAREAQQSFLADLRQGMVGGSSLVIRVRFSGCSFVLETRDVVTGDLIRETLDRRCSTWMFARGPLPNLTYPVREFGADLPWVVVFTD